ncbi:MAG: heme ABC transporter permease [Janthinobacterium lividum]
MIIKLLNPHNFNKVSSRLLPLLVITMLVLTAFGLYQALFASPIDYQQGEMVRVMYIHVPSAWMSLGIYVFIALCSFSNLIWKTRLTYIFAIASAPIGASFAIITLVTGSLWGKPIWGTWWVWDARLTSMLILFLFYMTYIAVVNSGDNLRRAEKPASVIALIGFINVPIVKFSVNLWYSLHQDASILKSGGPSIHISMLLPLILMFGSFICYFLVILILRTKTLLKIIVKNI